MNRSDSPLQFIKPNVPKGMPDQLRFAEYHDQFSTGLAPLDRIATSESMWRNVLCLYLTAAFVPTAEIARFVR